MSPVWITILLCSFTPVWSQDPVENPEIISDLEITSGPVGGAAHIRCNYRNKWQSSEVQWVKMRPEGPLIISLGTNIETSHQGKYKVTESVDSNVYVSVLTINKLTKADAGRYRCTIRTRHLPSPKLWSKKDGLLTVLDPEPGPPVVDSFLSDLDLTKGNVLLDPGESVEIDCTASGYPEPAVHWARTDEDRKGNKMEGGSVLVLQNVTKSDTGVYMCVADNGIEPTANKTIFIGVKTDDIQCHVPTVNKNVCIDQEGTSLEIDFAVYGFPIQNIEWYKGTEQNASLIVSQKTSSPRAKLVDRESKHFDWNTSFYRLIVSNVTESDVGSYFYRAIYNKYKECVVSIQIKSLCAGATGKPGNTAGKTTSSFSASMITLLATSFFVVL